MKDPEQQHRLEALIATLAPAPMRTAPTGDAGADVDSERRATAEIDGLLRRVSVLTEALSADAGDEWDDVGRLAAKLLIDDLSIISAATRALNALSASRLAGALADLRAARVDVEHSVKEASGS